MKSYESGIAHIPHWLRMTRAKLIIAGTVETAAVVMILLALNPGTRALIHNPMFLYFLIPVAVLIPVWAVRSFVSDSRSYQEFSYISSVKESGVESDIVRDYGGYCDVGNESKKLTYKTVDYCQCCGLVLVPGERKCRSCGAFSPFEQKITE